MVASWRDNACQDRLGARREDFIHDGLNRLTAATVTDTGTLAVLGATTAAYDAIGNITAKSDVGAYTYDGLAAGPHAVTRAGDVDYAYDANGNMASSSFVAGGAAHRAFAWSSFNKPVRMENSVTGAASEFVYGPGRARVKQTELQGTAVTQTTIYIGADFERVAPAAGSDELVHYIRAGAERVAIFTKVDDSSPATDKTRWLHKDHLGSIDLVTDEAGLAAETRSFDPWGRPRNADWTPAPADPFLAETPRGFTDHEHIQTVGLIHMNGRVQDPVLGRFISPDPSDALNPGVGFNRYSYALNNPVSLADPSGMVVETPWDVTMAMIGWGMAYNDLMAGNYMDATVGAVGALGDTVLAAIPGVPAFCTPAIGLARFGDDFLEVAVKLVDDVPVSTGARNEIPYWDYDAAEAAYEGIRQLQDDVAEIAANTGFPDFQIQRVKDHIFNNLHTLDDGIRRFDADPEIANAWERLQNGTHTQKDIDLLRHELAESKYEGIFSQDYRQSHKAVNERHPSPLDNQSDSPTPNGSPTEHDPTIDEDLTGGG